jgi:alkylation response protein AidB-like acyl-CoA dehydrogenase
MDMAIDPLARARALGDEIDAAADEIERTRRIPPKLLARVHEMRLGRMLLPRVFDGDETDPGTYLLAVAEVARHDASLAWNLFVANSAVLIAPHIPAAAARTIFAPADALVAWGPPNAAVATIEPGGYRVSGQWSFASGCRAATWMGIHCMVAEKGGEPLRKQDGSPDIRTLLVPVDQVTLIDTWDTIGLRGTASDSYSAEDLFVPVAFTGTREDPAGRRDPGPLYAIPMQELYAVGVAGVALGTARAMLEHFMRLANDKAPRSQVRLADQDAIQTGVALAEARIGSARAYLLEILADVYAHAPSQGVVDMTERSRIRLGCSNAIHGAIEVVDWAYKQSGVNSIFPTGPFQRRFRDIHTLSQQIQSRDAHFEAVGKAMLGNPPDAFYH